MINSKKIYLKAYTRKNLGDDLFVYIICNRYPNHTFYIKETKGYMDAFESISNLVVIKDVDDVNFDAIVYIGGSIFIENSELSIARVLQLKDEIIKEGVPTYIIGANFGPYKTQEYLNIVKDEIISNVTAITFRDVYSYNLFKELPNVYYAPDVIFSLDKNIVNDGRRKEIGMSVIHHLGRKELASNYSKYIDKLCEIAKYYIQLGYSIRLISFCEYEKDVVAIKDILDKMTKEEVEQIKIANYYGNIESVLNDIANLKLLVATRFHSAILGLKLQVPIIPICYSNKVIEVLKDVGFNKSNTYTFDTLDLIEYKKIPEVYISKSFDEAEKQFEQLDKIL